MGSSLTVLRGDGAFGCEHTASQPILEPLRPIVLTFWTRNLPIGAVVLGILQLFLRVRGTNNANRNKSIREKLKHMDPFGCLCFIAAVTCLLLAFQWGGQSRPWKSAIIIGLFVGAGLLAATFIFVQIKLEDKATIPPRVLKQRSILSGGGVLFFIGAACYVVCTPQSRNLLVNYN